MREFSLLFGGKAGDGIDRAGLILARILNHLGYRIYIYRDYPSLIRGGHTFSIIRASEDKILAHRDKVDFILALNQETLERHRDRLKEDCLFLYDSEQIKSKMETTCGIGLPLGKILKEENASQVMRNSCLIGGFCKALGIDWKVLEDVFKKDIPKELELNLKVAQRGYTESKELRKLESLNKSPLPILTGNEAIGLGLIKGGLKTYIAYPMTPSSTLLHFLAQIAPDFNLKVIHPENEIAVILMALGFAYMGEKTALGTSGGGFCLMTEGLSLSGMA
ncbi:MAG: 2-oxoacid:acceptor oxidoreductase family protein, partial [Candidatus Omnitrophica bacterium]|nr:2-oxoacid:acceptor oxidoreductase family protein [Candidatus Omnitrophota bacterium]